MELNGFTLPHALSEDLEAGRTKLTADQKQRLTEILTALEKPIPEMFDIDGICSENDLWERDFAHLYFGNESDINPPGNIDPQKTLIIGQAEPDSPIALDYRVDPPRVIYFGDIDKKTYWLLLSPNYETFIDHVKSSKHRG